MQEGLSAFGRATRIDAAVGDFFRVFMNFATAFGATVRHDNFAARISFRDHFHDVRDDVPGALHDHRIADVQTQPLNFVHVVQRRPGNDDAADLNRLEHRHRRERACAAHLKQDVIYNRRFLARRIFICDGPPRRFRRETQFLLHREFVHLDHDAVDFIRQFLALRFPGIDKFLHFVERVA